jgi:hypothetical protein
VGSLVWFCGLVVAILCPIGSVNVGVLGLYLLVASLSYSVSLRNVWADLGFVVNIYVWSAKWINCVDLLSVMGLIVILCDYGFEDIDGYIYLNAKNLCYLGSVIAYGWLMSMC